MMMKIDTGAWKPFRVVDLGFSVHHGQRLNKAQRIEGETPFITAGFENRGVTQYIGNDRPIYHKAITVDMFGNCFFQSEDCAGDDNVYFFVNDDMSDLVKLFISAGIGTMTFSKFDYARQFRQGDADNLEVMLPATLDGDPDWAYMESYMRGIMDREEIFAEHLASLTAEAVADSHVIDTSGWRDFVFRDVFAGPYIAHAYHAIELNLEDEPSGDHYEYVSRSCVDNAVQGYVSKCDGRYVAQPRGSICFGAETAYFTYHDVEYLTGNKMYWFLFDTTDSYVEYAQSSDAAVNARAIGLFLCAVLNAQLHNKFGYSDGLTGSRCGRQVIKLPATSDGNPDWAYMEQYMKRVMAVESAFAEELDRIGG